LIEAPLNSNNKKLPIGFSWRGGGLKPFYILPNGNVGIGTTSPNAKLEVIGQTIINGGVGVPSSGTLHIRQKGDSYGDGIAITSSYHTSHRLWKDSNGNLNIGPTGHPSTIVSTTTGNIGIGTKNPAYKLDVIGTIRTQELKVDMQGADFVFEDNYQLRSLEEVENFVQENKHLPEVAPAKEMQENGVNQSEMNQKLLQKIEELTLYVIELNKKISEQQKEIQILKEN
jgi:hypothetical protein